MDKALLALFNAGTISRETFEGALRDPAQASRASQAGQVRAVGAAR